MLATTTIIDNNEIAELEADHAQLVRKVELLKSLDSNYQAPDGFDADFTQWLKNLDSQIHTEQDTEFAQYDDMADWQASTTSGVLAF